MKENNLLFKQKCVILFNKTIPEFDTAFFKSMSTIIVVIDKSTKTKLF